MISTFYRVTITQPTGLSAPSDGFIDNTKLEYYIPVSVPTNYNASLAKVRANLRYLQLVLDIGMMANAYVSSIDTTGADANTPPTVFAMTLEFERGDGVLATWDELNPGQELFGTAAIARTIARALISSRTTNAVVYDPTCGTAPNNPMLYDRTGDRIDTVQVGPLATDLLAATTLITVAAVANI